MEAVQIAQIVSSSAAAVGLIFAAFMTYFNAKQIKLDRKMRSLEFSTGQFDRLDKIRVRQEVRALATGNEDVLTYTKNGEDKEKTQNLLEFIYTLNRISAGLYDKALDENIVFNLWTPAWFEGHWRRFEPLIAHEKGRRGREAEAAYVYFEWLAKNRCPELETKYPKLLHSTLGKRALTKLKGRISRVSPSQLRRKRGGAN